MSGVYKMDIKQVFVFMLLCGFTHVGIEMHIY